jgi:hypothetical protein
MSYVSRLVMHFEYVRHASQLSLLYRLYCFGRAGIYMHECRNVMRVLEEVDKFTNGVTYGRLKTLVTADIIRLVLGDETVTTHAVDFALFDFDWDTTSFDRLKAFLPLHLSHALIWHSAVLTHDGTLRGHFGVRVCILSLNMACACGCCGTSSIQVWFVLRRIERQRGSLIWTNRGRTLACA